MERDGINRREWLAAGSAVLAANLAAPGLLAATPATAKPIRLSLNENAFGPSPAVARAIAAGGNGLNRYVEQDEVNGLVAVIAALEKVAPEQVLIGEVLEPLGLHLARRRKDGGTIVYSAPGYTALIDSAAPLGGRGVPVPLNTRLANDLPALAGAITDDTLAISLVNPHNPSGTVDDGAAFDRFVSDAQARTLVVVDEAYLEYDDLAGRSAVRFVRQGANVLVFRTLAKAYGLAGLSIGYALAPAALVAELKQAGVGAPHSLNRLSLVAARAALADQAHIAYVRRATLAERVRVVAALDRLGLRHTDSRANFVFFDAGDRAAALRAAFSRRGIAIARPFPPFEQWLRITIGLPTENDAVLALLRETSRS